jgi:hypothetical protein
MVSPDSYERSFEVDETDWVINNFAHIYYCPFCGAFIKGQGYGNYDEKYPPSDKTKIVVQTR